MKLKETYRRNIKRRRRLQNLLRPIVHQCVTYGTLLILVRRDRGTLFSSQDTCFWWHRLYLFWTAIEFLTQVFRCHVFQRGNLCFALPLMYNNIFQLKNSWRYWVKLFCLLFRNVLYGNCRFVSARNVVLWTAGSFFCEEIVGLRSAQRVVLSTCQWMFVRVPRLNFGVV